jgi:NTP pyrophosphatase (non-canonical NTP hydrolase)
MLNELARECYEISKDHGFWDHRRTGYNKDEFLNPSIYPEKLALIHSEISEMLDALRDGDHAHEEEEATDVLIRLLDYAAERKFDMDKAVMAKMEKNRNRPYKHGRQF